MNLFIFSGQGSQYYQMGQELYAQSTIFKSRIQALDKIPKQELGISIIDIIYGHNKSEVFSRLLYTHPAIFMVEYAMAQTFIYAGIIPDYVIGSSLGEFTALAVSNIMDVEDSLRQVIKQAQLIEASCQPGGMVLASCNYEDILPLLSTELELAVINSTNNHVLSGKREHIGYAVQELKRQNIIHLQIPVDYGFHSYAIEEAKELILESYRKVSFHQSGLRMLSIPGVTKKDYIDEFYCWNILRNQINHPELLSKLIANNKCNIIDLSPTNSLANLAKNHNQNESSVIYSCLSPFGNTYNNFLNILSRIQNCS
jgi:acyl transferase domain-containing protein